MFFDRATDSEELFSQLALFEGLMRILHIFIRIAD